MIISDIHGHSIDWSEIDVTMLRTKVIFQSKQYLNRLKDPIYIFLEKITYQCFLQKKNKMTIQECKLLKRRLNGMIKKWPKDRIKTQLLEFVDLLERCINNRRCLYIFQDNPPLRIAA